MSNHVVEKDTPAWIEVGGPKPFWDFIGHCVRKMIRPEEAVERIGIAPPEIVEHSHGELKPAGQVVPPNKPHESLSRR